MSPATLAMVLGSALAHASWNLLAKNASGGRVFTWLCVACSALVTAPLAFVQHTPEIVSLGTGAWVFPAVSGGLHVAYFWFLSRAYAAGDLSLVYPLARGSGPLLASIVAILVLGERPSPLALGGILAVIVGVLCLTGDPRVVRRSGNGPAVSFAMLTGATIATYTLWDKYAVSAVGIPPVVYFWASMTICALGLAPLSVTNAETIKMELGKYWRLGLAAGTLIALAYILVLTAFTTSPVTHVATIREIGILFGAILGQRLLSEGHNTQRIVGAALMVLGVAALAVG